MRDARRPVPYRALAPNDQSLWDAYNLLGRRPVPYRALAPNDQSLWDAYNLLGRRPVPYRALAPNDQSLWDAYSAALEQCGHVSRPRRHSDPAE
jgi:hypothetical protein